MKRWLGASVLVSVIAVALAACSDSSGDGYYGAVPAGGGSACSQYTSCGTCTPVEGCGWCFTTSGGQCASRPDECANLQEFTWSWNPSGCPGVDASVEPLDAGPTSTEAGRPSADASEASPGDEDAASRLRDAGSGG